MSCTSAHFSSPHGYWNAECIVLSAWGKEPLFPSSWQARAGQELTSCTEQAWCSELIASKHIGEVCHGLCHAPAAEEIQKGATTAGLALQRWGSSRKADCSSDRYVPDPFSSVLPSCALLPIHQWQIAEQSCTMHHPSMQVPQGWWAAGSCRS